MNPRGLFVRLLQHVQHLWCVGVFTHPMRDPDNRGAATTRSASLQTSSHVLSTFRLNSALRSSGSDDNQNFCGGQDGVSRLVSGKSMPVCQLPQRRTNKNQPKHEEGFCFNDHFLSCSSNPAVRLSDCPGALWTTTPRAVGASGQARTMRVHTHAHTGTHARETTVETSCAHKSATLRVEVSRWCRFVDCD